MGFDQLARDGKIRLALRLTAIVDGLLRGHLIHQRGDVLSLCQFTGPVAAVARHKLVLTVLTDPKDYRLPYTVCLDTGDEAAVGFVRLLGDEHAGQVMDFCQGNGLRLGFAVFICH